MVLHEITTICGALAIVIASGGCGSSGSGNAGGSSGSGGAGHHGGAGGTIDFGTGNSGGNGTTTKPPVGCGSVVTGTVRDFHAGLDFQCTNSGYVDPTNKACGPWDPEIVGALGSLIGPDRKPVYA